MSRGAQGRENKRARKRGRDKDKTDISRETKQTKENRQKVKDG